MVKGVCTCFHERLYVPVRSSARCSYNLVLYCPTDGDITWPL